MDWLWDIFWFLMLLLIVDHIFLDATFTDAIVSRIQRKDN